MMVLGVGITGTMIRFNIQRELLMERIRIFRAELDIMHLLNHDRRAWSDDQRWVD